MIPAGLLRIFARIMWRVSGWAEDVHNLSIEVASAAETELQRRGHDVPPRQHSAMEIASKNARRGRRQKK